MTPLFVAIWFIIGLHGQQIGTFTGSTFPSASECMKETESENTIQYLTGMAVLNQVPFKKLEGTCGVVEAQGVDA